MYRVESAQRRLLCALRGSTSSKPAAASSTERISRLNHVVNRRRLYAQSIPHATNYGIYSWYEHFVHDSRLDCLDSSVARPNVLQVQGGTYPLLMMVFFLMVERLYEGRDTLPKTSDILLRYAMIYRDILRKPPGDLYYSRG